MYISGNDYLLYTHIPQKEVHLHSHKKKENANNNDNNQDIITFITTTLVHMPKSFAARVPEDAEHGRNGRVLRLGAEAKSAQITLVFMGL